MSRAHFVTTTFGRLQEGPMTNHDFRKIEEEHGAYQKGVAMYVIRQNGWLVENKRVNSKTVSHKLTGKRDGYQHDDADFPWKATDWPGNDTGQPLPKITTLKGQAVRTGKSVKADYESTEERVEQRVGRGLCVDCYGKEHGKVPAFGSLRQGTCSGCGKWTKVVG